MRKRSFLLAASVTSLAAAAIAQGCGGTESATSSDSDGGADVALDNATKKDTAPADDGAPPCDTTKDFTTEIPDADIADGASSTGICLGCAKKNCKTYIDDCNKNCECQGIAGDALECYAKNGGDVLKCIGSLAKGNVSKKTQSTGVGLFTCLSGACKDECQTEKLTDGGIKDSGDSG